MGEAPSLRAGGFQTYMFIIPGSVAPVNLKALKSSQGRHHITRGNNIPGRLGPGFASHLTKWLLFRC